MYFVAGEFQYSNLIVYKNEIDGLVNFCYLSLSMKKSLFNQSISFVIISFFLAVSFVSAQPHSHQKDQEHRGAENCSLCHLNQIITSFSIVPETIIKKIFLVFYDCCFLKDLYPSTETFDCFIERAPPRS